MAMTSYAFSWLPRLVRLLPSPILIMLDAWSQGVARKRAELRRQRAIEQAAAK